MDRNALDTLFDANDAIGKEGIEKDLFLLPPPSDI